jgi:hypothetical protein
MHYSEPIEPKAEVQFQQEGVPGKTPCGERFLPAQGLQAYRHTLRQIGPELPRVGPSRGHHRLVDFMSLGPSKYQNDKKLLRDPRTEMQPLVANAV